MIRLMYEFIVFKENTNCCCQKIVKFFLYYHSCYNLWDFWILLFLFYTNVEEETEKLNFLFWQKDDNT